MKTLRAADRVVAGVLRWGVIATLAVILALVILGVVMRLLGWFSVTWTDEAIEPLMGYMVFLCAVALWRERAHFTVEVLNHALPVGVRRPIQLIIEALGLAFALVFLWQALPFALGATEESPFLQIPKKYMFLVMPVAAALMTVYSVRDLVTALQRVGDTEPGTSTRVNEITR